MARVMSGLEWFVLPKKDLGWNGWHKSIITSEKYLKYYHFRKIFEQSFLLWNHVGAGFGSRQVDDKDLCHEAGIQGQTWCGHSNQVLSSSGLSDAWQGGIGAQFMSVECVNE